MTQHETIRLDCLQAAIGHFAGRNRRAIYHEGLTRAKREQLSGALRHRGLVCEVRNARQVRYPEIRLADALAGMIAKVRFGTDAAEHAHLMRDWFVEL